MKSTAQEITSNIDAAFLAGLHIRSQRIGYPVIPLPVARRLATTGKVSVRNGVVEVCK